MKINLKELKKFIKKWPSDYEIGICSSNWLTHAQSFYFAAKVLAEENEKAQASSISNQSIITTEYMMRTQTDLPIKYCLGFAIELATKAALVKSNHSKYIKPHKLHFQTHSILGYIENDLHIPLTPHQQKCIQELNDVVMTNRYPTGTKPSPDAFSTIPSTPIKLLFQELEGVYDSLTTKAI